MSLYILAPDANGNCCDCSVRADPCDTCSSCLSCRSKGNGGSVPSSNYCGFDEYILEFGYKYTKQTIGGSVSCCRYNADIDGCTTVLFGTFGYSFNGDLDYDTYNCIPGTNNQIANFYGYHFGDPGIVCPASNLLSQSTIAIISFPCGSIGVNLTETSTNVIFSYDGSCPAIFQSRNAGTATMNLTNPVTAGDAAHKYANSLSWSDWGGSCIAILNGNGVATSQFRDVQWQVLQSNLIANTQYSIEVKYYRKSASGSGDWILYQTDLVTDTTDENGAFSATGDVPNDNGYQTEPRCDCIFTLVP